MWMIIARKAHFKLTAFVLEITTPLEYYNSFSRIVALKSEARRRYSGALDNNHA